jgi:hypothetical protein
VITLLVRNPLIRRGLPLQPAGTNICAKLISPYDDRILKCKQQFSED